MKCFPSSLARRARVAWVLAIVIAIAAPAGAQTRPRADVQPPTVVQHVDAVFLVQWGDVHGADSKAELRRSWRGSGAAERSQRGAAVRSNSLPPGWRRRAFVGRYAAALNVRGMPAFGICPCIGSSGKPSCSNRRSAP